MLRMRGAAPDPVLLLLLYSSAGPGAPSLLAQSDKTGTAWQGPGNSFYKDAKLARKSGRLPKLSLQDGQGVSCLRNPRAVLLGGVRGLCAPRRWAPGQELGERLPALTSKVISDLLKQKRMSCPEGRELLAARKSARVRWKLACPRSLTMPPLPGTCAVSGGHCYLERSTA